MKATRSFAGASAGRRICKNNWISFHANVISRRQLHNPMFPQRALPEINETKVKQGESDDFLSKHGGKVFATCMAAVFGLLYTYIKSNSMRSDLEDALSDERIVEPFETNAARARNQKFKKEVFDDIIASCYSHFPEKECTYSEFVSFVKQILFSKYGVVIADAHLLDRTIQAKCLKLALTEQNPQLSLLSSIDYNKNDEGILSAAHSKALTLLANHKFPLHYLLIVLSTVVRERAGLRVESLFSIAKYSDDWRGDSMDDSMADGCSSSAVLEVVTDLCETWQVYSITTIS